MRASWSSLGILVLSGCAAGNFPGHGKPPRQMSNGALADWHNLTLPGKLRTSYTKLTEEGQPVVLAESASSASMLRRHVRIEPASLGIARFSWRVPGLIDSADLTDRDTSDSPVRLILAFDGDHGRLSSRNRMLFDLMQAVTGEVPPYATLMYVWDNKAPTESIIHSGRSDRIRKIVIESGNANVGAWRHYERDIAADFRKSFGEEPGALIAVGLMTDSDNTRSSAKAWYGEVRLIGRDGRVF